MKIDIKSLGRSINSVGRRASSVGGVAKFDKDKDGFVTGPDGEDNVVAPVRALQREITTVLVDDKSKQISSEQRLLLRKSKTHKIDIDEFVKDLDTNDVREIQKRLIDFFQESEKLDNHTYSKKEIAEKFNVAPLTVQKIMNSAYPEYAKKHKKWKSDVDEARIKFVKENDHLLKREIADIFAVSEGLVKIIRQNAGLPPRVLQPKRGRAETYIWGGKTYTRDEFDNIRSQLGTLIERGYSGALAAEKIGIPFQDEIRKWPEYVKAEGPSTEEAVLNLAIDGYDGRKIADTLKIKKSEVKRILEEAGGFSIEMPKREQRNAWARGRMHQTSLDREVRQRGSTIKGVTIERNNERVNYMDISIDIKGLGGIIGRFRGGAGSPAEFDGDGDGMLTGPDGQDNIPAPARAAVREAMQGVMKIGKGKPQNGQGWGAGQNYLSKMNDSELNDHIKDLDKAYRKAAGDWHRSPGNQKLRADALERTHLLNSAKDEREKRTGVLDDRFETAETQLLKRMSDSELDNHINDLDKQARKLNNRWLKSNGDDKARGDAFEAIEKHRNAMRIKRGRLYK